MSVILGRLSVFPTLPAELSRLEELSYNLWWSWTPEAQTLFSDIDAELWDSPAVYHNPVKFLRDVDQTKLNATAQNADYLTHYHSVLAQFDEYMGTKDTWFARSYPDHIRDGMQIAYFSAEFGLHESLPIYSGGLGILAGDHCKSASDLGLPFVGVGFLYPQGYFRQQISPDGIQEAIYNKLDLNEVPARPAMGDDGKPVWVQVELPGRTVTAQVWIIQVGRIQLLMLDTDVDPNAPSDRDLAARLYGGDTEMRISQEIILGIGGVRALRRLGYNPTVFHMNEGHSAFLGLERIRELVQGQGLTFAEGVEATRPGNIFTTHTPVPAGNDAFAFELVERYFYTYWPKLGIGRDEFLNLARHDMAWGAQFSMTVLAVRLSAQANGVSELHGQVSRDMWKSLWSDTPVDEIPITHVTNGVHHQTWVHPVVEVLLNNHLPANWLDEMDKPETWEPVYSIPDRDLWDVRETVKTELADFVRKRMSALYHRQGRGPAMVRAAESLLNPKALTLGFARRFATYKRATLMFRDVERLKRILNDPDRPVQIIFSGKSHPADNPGKEFIRQVVQYSQHPDFFGKIVFLEDYEMNVARHMLAGVDVWLNNPRRPLEASGTSGEKAAMNGAPNFSVLDGWWREGWDGKNGWAIGEERAYANTDEQDLEDSLSFYDTLEGQIVPLFYDRNDEGIPAGWLEVVKASIASLSPRFSMHRQVKDYTNLLYHPAQVGNARVTTDDFMPARQLAMWKSGLRSWWNNVAVDADTIDVTQTHVGETLAVTAQVHLGDLDPGDVRVEFVTGQEEQGELRYPDAHEMTVAGTSGEGIYRYELRYSPYHSGRHVYGVRVVPNHPNLFHKLEMGLVKWA